MQVYSFFLEDQNPKLIEVEFHSRFQIPSFQILGLPAPEIQEARERIIAAFQASDYDFPKKKVLVNLSPSSIRKSGTGHDLAIAIKVLESTLDLKWPDHLLAWGELSLEGELKPVGKMATLIELLIKMDHRPSHLNVILSQKDYQYLKKLLSWRAKNNLANPEHCRFSILHQLSDLTAAMDKFETCVTNEVITPEPIPQGLNLLPLSPMQARTLQISFIGMHHVLLLGPKGVGKSEALQWYRLLLPEPKAQILWDQTLALESRSLPADFQAPVRQVHSGVKPAHLLGSFGSKGFQAGELSLAHGGILIADEFVEWPRDAKECLREPLQSKKVTLTRVRGSIESKCELQLIATGNLCPCGGLPAPFRAYQNNKNISCRCRGNEVQNYFQRLSGPILDRIDLTVLVSSTVTSRQMSENNIMDQLHTLKKQIKNGRAFAIEKFGALPSQLHPQWLESNLPDSQEVKNLLSDVTSLRARHKILRVARSIQALEASPLLQVEHIFESKNYRFMDKVLA